MPNCKTTSDEILVSLIHKGNNVAFRELFDRYWDRLYVAAYKVIGEEMVCEDIVQDIFLDILVRSSGLTLQNVKAYLYQAVRYQVAGHMKKMRFVDKRAEILEDCPSANNTEEQISFHEVKNRLDESFALLPTRCREVFYLSRFEDLSNKQIAAKLGISVFTVETHMKKALKFLRNTLDPATLMVIAFFFM